MSKSILAPTTGLLFLFATSCSGDASQVGAAASSQEPQGNIVEPESYSLSAESAARHGIKTAPVELRVLRRRLVAPGRVAFNATRTGHIQSPLRGRITSAPAALGETVVQGQTLVVLDSPELGEAQIQLLLRQGALQSARPQVTFAKEAWQRAKNLFDESQGVSRSEVARREAEYARVAAVLREAEVAANAADNRLSVLGMQPKEIAAVITSGKVSPQLTIRAPFDGKVVMRDVTLGELVSPDNSTMMTISDVASLWVMVAVPESRLPDVVVGAKASIHLGGQAGLQFTGEVTLIAPTVDATTRTAEVRVEVAQPGDQLRPGSFVTARIDVPVAAADQAGTLAVPEMAVQTIDRRTVVFMPVPGVARTYHMRPVVVGPAVDGFLPVRAGLQAGEQVVNTGSFVLKAQATQNADEGDN